MKVLYFDCFSGASGDMIVGALIDAGVPLDEIRGALGSLSIDRDAVWTERVQRAGIGATKFQVRGEDANHAHHHQAHAGGVATEAHAHRTLPDIYALIDESRLSAAGKNRAKALFARLGEVERHLGIKLERVDAKLEKLGEGMDAMRTEIIREIRERDERQSQRMDDLEDVVRRHSRDISAIHKRLPVSK